MTSPYRNGGPDAPCSKCAKRETWAHRREYAGKLFRQYGEGAGFYLVIVAFIALISWGGVSCYESNEEREACEAECLAHDARFRAVVGGRCFCSQAGEKNGRIHNDDLPGSPFEVTRR